MIEMAYDYSATEMVRNRFGGDNVCIQMGMGGVEEDFARIKI